MRVGRYEVVGVLGKGGMGVVYSARDGDGQKVALKVLTRLGLAADSRARFAREVEGLSRLAHPTIVALLDHGTTPDGAPYLVMPLVSGRTLAERLRAEGTLPQDEAARLARELATALEHAHSRGVVHRDVKPSNVLLDAEGRPHLVDFGLARLLADDERISVTGDVVGTPAYMAPEQASGERAAPAPQSDVYGLGATLYEMLTGSPPLRGTSLVNLLNAIMSRPPTPVAALRPDVDPALAALCERCLEKDPAARFPTARALADALTAVIATRSRRRGGVPLVATLVALAGALLLGVVGLRAGARGSASTDEVAPPSPLELEVAAAEAALGRGDLPVGLAAASRAVDLDPRSAAAHGVLGQLLLRWGDAPGAVRALERAVALGATAPLALTARATARLAAGDAARALGAALEAVRLHPTFAPAHVQVAHARGALGDRPGALLALNRAVDLAPRDPDVRRARAKDRLVWAPPDALPGALEDARVVLETGGGAADDWLLLARLHHAANDRGLTLAAVEEALARDPRLVGALRLRAALRAIEGDAAGSLADWTEAVRLEPEHTNTRRERAMLLLAQDRETEALGEVSEVLARNPTDGQALLLRGAIHERRGEVVAAYEDLHRAVVLLGPRSWHVRQQARSDPLLQAILRMGPVQHDARCAAWMAVAETQRETAEVLRATERALEVHPRCPEVLGRRALMWYRKPNYAAAEADARAALAGQPGHALANTVTGLLALRAGRFDDAIAATTSALATEPRLPAALGARGQARLHAGDAQGGLEDADAALAVEPGLVLSRETRAEALRALGERAEALQECARALELEPRALGPRVVRGWILLDQGDAAGALAEADHVIEKDPRAGRGHGLRAAAREALGDLDGARADCEKALSLTLLPPHRGEVEARLRRLGSRR